VIGLTSREEMIHQQIQMAKAVQTGAEFVHHFLFHQEKP